MNKNIRIREYLKGNFWNEKSMSRIVANLWLLMTLGWVKLLSSMEGLSISIIAMTIPDNSIKNLGNLKDLLNHT